MLRRVLIAIFLFVIISYNTPHSLCWSLTHFGEGHKDFVIAGKKLVEERVPEWYQADVEIGFGTHSSNLAHTSVDKKGKVDITITQRALKLCAAGDMAAILLHEYVHAELWEDIALAFPDPVCNNVRHELTANWIVIQNHGKLKYTDRMFKLSINLYEHYYLEGLFSCSPKVHYGFPHPAGLPEWPS